MNGLTVEVDSGTCQGMNRLPDGRLHTQLLKPSSNKQRRSYLISDEEILVAALRVSVDANGKHPHFGPCDVQNELISMEKIPHTKSKWTDISAEYASARRIASLLMRSPEFVYEESWGKRARKFRRAGDSDET